MADGAGRGVRGDPCYPKSARDSLVARAHLLVHIAIKRGTLPEQETQLCVDCGAQAECYDHRNYHEPPKVGPVCKPCNTRRGPGFPYPTQEDGLVHKILLPEGAKSAGRLWDSLIGGEGYGLTEYCVHAEVDWAEIEEATDSLERRFTDSQRRKLYANHSLRSFPGYGRYEYFKARDPWAIDAEAV